MEEQYFKLSFSVENDAFQNGNLHSEIARILRELANKVEGNPTDSIYWYQNIHDTNGNTIGTYAVKPNENLLRK
jgi:hypothetical protein